MKRSKIILVLAGLLLAFQFVQAQIGMKLSTEYSRFLRYEPISLKLLLRNYSGNTLVFGEKGEGQGKLLFSVTSASGQLVSPLDPNANPLAGVIFAPGESREVTVTLNALYDLQKDDYYNVTAYIDHKRLPQAFASNQVTFEVREGILMKEKVIGLPAVNPDDMIKNVTASLMRFNDGTNEIYTLRIEDDDCVYGTFRIGPYIATGVPQLDADGTSAIHVLVQVRPKLYSYAVYAIVGGEAKLRQQKYYLPDTGVPVISRAAGYLKILYAKPAVEGVDYQFGEENRKPRYTK